MTKIIHAKLVVCTLLLLIITAGCSKSSSVAETKDIQSVKTRVSQLEESNRVQTDLMSVQLLNDQKQYAKAEKVLETIINSTNGKQFLTAENKLAKDLLNHIKMEQSAKAQEPETQFKTYTNSRFGYSIQYPDTFQMGLEPTNNDGREFSDGICQITSSGAHAVEDNPLQTEKDWAIQEVNGTILYQKTGDNWFVLSYQEGSTTVYKKTMLNDGISFSIVITYPSDKQNTYGPIVSHIVSTFVPGHSD
ncbi:hypothetical protein [Neobacillus sp. SAB-20_R2A]|uniref:hypothetical protein n=1 Tax=Neobacillus sp. SAB-20_R2A TaxID=3120519 RepID=UPI003C6E2747